VRGRDCPLLRILCGHVLYKEFSRSVFTVSYFHCFYVLIVCMFLCAAYCAYSINDNNNNNSLLKEIGLKISTSFLYQCISVLVQLFNAILLQDSLPTVDCTD